MSSWVSTLLNGVIVSGQYGVWTFPNPTQKLFKYLDQQFISRDQHFYHTSQFIYSFLKNIAFDTKWIVTVKDPTLYRRVSGSGPGADPLSIVGSFGFGGRFNIGTAQASLGNHPFKGLSVSPRGAHYSSEDKTTARQEFGDVGMPGSTAVTYQLKLRKRKQLKLIDADMAVRDLSSIFIALPDIIQGGTLGGAYLDIKKIIPTQLFAHWLLQHCPTKVDGIIFNSQVNPNKRNYCLHLATNEDCKKLLTIIKKV